MKRFKILGIIAILIIAVDAVLYFTNNWNDISQGWNDGQKVAQSQWEGNNQSSDWGRVIIDVFPDETIVQDSLMNTKLDKHLPYRISQITTDITVPQWGILFTILLALTLPALLIGFICLIKLLITVAKKDVFNPNNSWRIRLFAYSLFAYHFIGTLYEWYLNNQVLAQISLPGYELAHHAVFAGEWSMIVTIVLFAEVFAVAIKIKEEQDLTI